MLLLTAAHFSLGPTPLLLHQKGSFRTGWGIISKSSSVQKSKLTRLHGYKEIFPEPVHSVGKETVPTYTHFKLWMTSSKLKILFPAPHFRGSNLQRSQTSLAFFLVKKDRLSCSLVAFFFWFMLFVGWLFWGFLFVLASVVCGGR